MVKLPVLIVGAGPTGLLLAIELARRAVPFRLIDRNPQPLGWDRATVVKPRSLEIFDNLSLADDFLARGRIVRSVALFSEGEKVATVTFDHLDSRFPHLLSLPESETEAILTAELERHGGTVDRGRELVHLEQDNQSVRVRIRGIDNGAEETLDTDWVVGTDGLHSAVRGAVHDDFVGHDNPVLWAVVDANLEGWRHSGNAIAAQLQFPAANPIPLGDGRWRIYFRPGSQDPGVLDEVETGLKTMSPEVKLGKHDEPRFFHTHSRVAKRYRVGQVLVAGDAAHACSPIQGHGMNAGIQDAYNLGWKIALAVNGRASKKLIDSYEAERRPIAQLIVRSGDKADAEFVRQDHVAQQALIADLASPSGNRNAALSESEIAHGYTNSPIIDALAETWKTGGPTPLGFRIGDVSDLGTSDGRRRLHEILRSPGHLLFATLGDAGEKALAEALGVVVEVVRPYQSQIIGLVVARTLPGVEIPPGVIHDPTGSLHNRLASRSPSLCVIRPDGHMAFRGSINPGDGLNEYLERVFCR